MAVGQCNLFPANIPMKRHRDIRIRIESVNCCKSGGWVAIASVRQDDVVETLIHRRKAGEAMAGYEVSVSRDLLPELLSG